MYPLTTPLAIGHGLHVTVGILGWQLLMRFPEIPSELASHWSAQCQREIVLLQFFEPGVRAGQVLLDVTPKW